MPEWVFYFLIAFMWIFGFILIILFVFIMVYIFGNQLKKLGFHISVKDGIGVDVETHQPQTNAVSPLDTQKTLNTSNLSTVQQTQQLERDQVIASDLPPAKPANSTQDSDMKYRIKKILELFNGQEFSGALFGKKIKIANTLLPSYDERIEIFHFDKVSFLSKTLNAQMDILAETNGAIGVKTESLKTDILSSGWNVSHEEYTRLYALCLSRIPENYEQWYSGLVKKINLLSRDSLVWVIISGNFPENIRYKHQHPKILTSTLADIEVLELELGYHRTT